MTDTPQKYVVLGAGSIGCYLGGLLVSSGLDVKLVGRERYRAQIAEHGLTLTHMSREPIHVDKVDFQTDPAAIKDADYVLLCTKSQDTEAAAQQVKLHAPRHVTVISFQNGVSNADVLRKILPDSASVIPAIVPFNVTPTGPGVFHCGTAGDLVMGSAPLIIFNGFESAGQGVHVSGNIAGDQWAKMIVNLNNALNALTGGTLVEGLMQRDYRRALALCVEEALDVAKATGITVGTFNGRKPQQLLKTLRLPNFLYKLVMQKIVKIDAKARSSMLDDLEAGRVSEIDYLQGEIVCHAKAAGVAAPSNARILAMANSAFEAGQSPKLTGTQILREISP